MMKNIKTNPNSVEEIKELITEFRTLNKNQYKFSDEELENVINTINLTPYIDVRYILWAALNHNVEVLFKVHPKVEEIMVSSNYNHSDYHQLMDFVDAIEATNKDKWKEILEKGPELFPITYWNYQRTGKPFSG